MHIACSPYFSKIYKFRPYFRSVSFLGFPPALTMMHLVIILYMYWRLLLELYGPGCHSVTGPSDRPQNPQTDLKTLRPTSGPSDRPQDPQMDFRTLRPTSGLSDRPQDPQTDLTTLRPTSSIIWALINHPRSLRQWLVKADIWWDVTHVVCEWLKRSPCDTENPDLSILFSWLIAWSIVWVIDTLIDWLIDWWIDWFVDWLNLLYLERTLCQILIDWFIYWFIDWSCCLQRELGVLCSGSDIKRWKGVRGRLSDHDRTSPEGIAAWVSMSQRLSSQSERFSALHGSFDLLRVPWIMGSVSTRVQKEDVCLLPELKFWT